MREKINCSLAYTFPLGGRWPEGPDEGIAVASFVAFI